MWEKMMKQDDWKKILYENKLNEVIGKVVLKPKELGEGVPVTVHIDDEGYLVLKDKKGILSTSVTDCRI